MIGTEKQIKWAQDIQNSMLSSIDKIASDFEKAALGSPDAEGVKNLREIIASARLAIENQKDATWFINRAKVNIFRKDIPAIVAGKF